MDPTIYKPLIDAEFRNLAEILKVDLVSVQNKLDLIDPKSCGAWRYLLQAIEQTRTLLVSPEFKKMLQSNMLRDLWFPTDQYACFGGYTANYDDYNSDDYDVNYIFSEYYPEEAHEALAQENYWGGADADVFGLWTTENKTKVYHAHMEGFWILGEDPADFLKKAVEHIILNL